MSDWISATVSTCCAIISFHNRCDICLDPQKRRRNVDRKTASQSLASFTLFSFTLQLYQGNPSSWSSVQVYIPVKHASAFGLDIPAAQNAPCCRLSQKVMRLETASSHVSLEPPNSDSCRRQDNWSDIKHRQALTADLKETVFVIRRPTWWHREKLLYSLWHVEHRQAITADQKGLWL